ncbi:hypothetical protein V8C26DRAFT_363067 [Trichoderma gracile]
MYFLPHLKHCPLTFPGIKPFELQKLPLDGQMCKKQSLFFTDLLTICTCHETRSGLSTIMRQLRKIHGISRTVAVAAQPPVETSHIACLWTFPFMRIVLPEGHLNHRLICLGSSLIYLNLAGISSILPRAISLLTA